MVCDTFRIDKMPKVWFFIMGSASGKGSMNRMFFTIRMTAVCLFMAAAPSFAADRALPVIDGKETVATVNNEPITLEEFSREISFSHASRSGDMKAGRVDFSGILTRIINTRLIVLEAREMGLHELPEIRNSVNQYSKDTLGQLLLEQQVKDVKADEAEVARIYRDLVREWKIRTVQIKKEEDAKRIEEEIKAGKDFDEVAKKAIGEGTATGAKEGGYVKNQDLTLPIARLVAKMEMGSVSPIVSAGKKGFVIFRLEGERFPEEDQKAMEKARLEVQERSKLLAAKDFYEALKKKYTRMNKELFDSLDFESEEPGIEKLLKDERVILEIEDEKPITVGEFSRTLKETFYHGLESSIETKRVNRKKEDILEGMLQRRVLLKEALKQGIDRTDAYRGRMRRYEDSAIFGLFVTKVVDPEVKLNADELKAYYKEHIQDYTPATMVRIKSLVFEKRRDAEDALDKLKKGADFGWLSAHAEGQVDKDTAGIVEFEGKLLSLTTLPEDAHKAVAGAKPGDFRLYASPQGHYYALYVYDVVSPDPKSFEAAKAEIAKKVFSDKRKKIIEEYGEKLKEFYPVRIYATDLR